MDILVERIVDTILYNNCRYVEIDVEEFGRGAKTDFSCFKILVRSFDQGFELETLRLMIEEIITFSITNLKFISYHFESNTRYEYSNTLILSQQISKSKDLGTSISFEFTSTSSFPLFLHSLISNPKYSSQFSTNLRFKSSFQDLSQLNLCNCQIYEPDYMSMITESIQSIISQSPRLQHALTTL